MADEQATETAAPEAAPAVDPIQAARDLLIANGLNVVDNGHFKSIRESAAAEANAKAAEIKLQLEQVQSEHAKAAARLREIDDAGKSEAQKHVEQRAEWQRQIQERDKALEAATQSHAQAMDALRKTQVDNRLSALFSNCADQELALMAARARIPGELSVTDSGQLQLVDAAGVPHVGEAADAIVRAWWTQPAQAPLRLGAPSGPPTSQQSGRSVPDVAPVFDLDKIAHLPLEQQLKLAEAAEARDAQRR